ncbi:IS3 family transposase [Amycolatopsis sp. CA-128772]|uniref:IS3 family transposase n=1 Tax=Amycolatopsis sp. CA-128772 TaxID=2073159 RepID=UPI00351A556F
MHRRGHLVNHKRVERLMRENGLTGITRRKRRTTTRPAAGPVAPALPGHRDRPAHPGGRRARHGRAHAHRPGLPGDRPRGRPRSCPARRGFHSDRGVQHTLPISVLNVAKKASATVLS